MTPDPRSTVAQILFSDAMAFDFAHVVSELDRSLGGCAGPRHRVVWEGEAAAVLELGGTRIVLTRTDLSGRGRSHPVCLSVSVGTVPDHTSDTPLGRRHAGLARLIADRIQERCLGDAVIWSEVEACMTTEMLTALCDRLPAAQPKAVRQIVANPSVRAAHAAARDRAKLQHARTAIYLKTEEDAPATPSVPLRVAATAVNTTLTVVALPIGATLMALSLVRGADMRLSGQAMALTGLFLALSQTPAAQSLLATL